MRCGGVHEIVSDEMLIASLMADGDRYRSVITGVSPVGVSSTRLYEMITRIRDYIEVYDVPDRAPILPQHAALAKDFHAIPRSETITWAQYDAWVDHIFDERATVADGPNGTGDED